MTAHEFSSRSIQIQIYFWDTVIWMMRVMQTIRDRYQLLINRHNSDQKPIRSITISLIWLALGLYLGIFFGFLGI